MRELGMLGSNRFLRVSYLRQWLQRWSCCRTEGRGWGWGSEAPVQALEVARLLLAEVAGWPPVHGHRQAQSQDS